MKIKRRFIFIILVSFFIIIGMNTNYSNAALQSNIGTPAKKTIAEWLLQIRQMQAFGGTLGRSDNINGTTLLSNATDLDIHMEKNTEYGAMAILSASAYGKPTPISSGETTTGNSTGIVINLNNEVVSAGGAHKVPLFVSANNRYKNYYGDRATYVYKAGDVITETMNWHGSKYSLWFMDQFGNADNGGLESVLLRAIDKGGSIFSYYAQNRDRNTSSPLISFYTNPWYSRAVIVVGAGI